MTGKEMMLAALNGDYDKDSLDPYSFLKGWNAAVRAIDSHIAVCMERDLDPMEIGGFLAVPDADNKEASE